MKVRLEFFGAVRDRMKDCPATLTLEPGTQTLDALVAMLADRLDDGEVLRDPNLRFAINDHLVASGEMIALGEGDCISVLSPFSGG